MSFPAMSRARYFRSQFSIFRRIAPVVIERVQTAALDQEFLEIDRAVATDLQYGAMVAGIESGSTKNVSPAGVDVWEWCSIDEKGTVHGFVLGKERGGELHTVPFPLGHREGFHDRAAAACVPGNRTRYKRDIERLPAHRDVLADFYVIRKTGTVGVGVGRADTEHDLSHNGLLSLFGSQYLATTS